MKSARTPALAVIVAVLLAALVFDPEPRRLTTVATLSSVPIAPSSVSGPAAKNDVWFCAGGTAVDGGIADHRVLLVNTTDIERVASITAAGSRSAENRGTSGSRRVTLPPYARSELRLAELVPNAAYASATVELSGGGVLVEHSVTGTNGAFDRAPCASAASTEWFVPLSATATEKNPTARAVLVIYNPFADTAVIDINFVTDTASAAAPIESMVIAPGAVESVDLTALVPVADQ